MTPEISSLIESAKRLAEVGGWSGIGIEHAYLAILDDEIGGAILSQTGVNVADLRTQIEWILRGAPKRTLGFDLAAFVTQLETFELPSKRTVGVGTVLSYLILTQTAPSKLLADQGVSRVDILYVMAHGVGRSASLPTARVVSGGQAVEPTKRALYRVVVHNDPFTLFSVVSKLLLRHTKLGQEAATDMGREIDRTGSAVLGTYKLKEAQKLVGAICRDAHLEGHPLRLSYEPVPG